MRVAWLMATTAVLGACSWKLDVGSPKGVCAPESDSQFCARWGKECDSYSDLDNCGEERRADCGQCQAPKQCGARFAPVPNVCGWVGVGWLSGVTIESPTAFGHWRNHPVEILSVWNDLDTWQNMENVPVLDDLNSRAIPWTENISIAQALFPVNGGNLADCAAGKYDDHYRTIATKFKTTTWCKAYVRLGWQDNIDCTWCSTAGQESNWKACFRHAATIFRDICPESKILWNMNRRIAGDVTLLWPGDDVVDVVAVDFYDMPPYLTDQKAWDNDFASHEGNGPRGLGTWIEFARAHGKQLALPEWGISGLNDDNSFFIGKMYEFFWSHVDDIAFEALFNGIENNDNYRLYPVDATNGHPNAAARYRELFTDGLLGSSLSTPGGQ